MGKDRRVRRMGWIGLDMAFLARFWPVKQE
jgi:hypothetical protein